MPVGVRIVSVVNDVDVSEVEAMVVEGREDVKGGCLPAVEGSAVG